MENSFLKVSTVYIFVCRVTFPY